MTRPDFTLDFALSGITEAAGAAIATAVAVDGFTVTVIDDQGGAELPEACYLFQVAIDGPIDDILHSVRSNTPRDVMVECDIFMQGDEPLLVGRVYGDPVPGLDEGDSTQRPQMRIVRN